jgi:hypothetical protein
MAAKRRRRVFGQAQRSAIALGQIENFELATLRLDHRNPRLPENLKAGSQDDLLRYIADEYEPLEIGKSIARHGYFRSEPIIVVHEGGENVVVEGNRRLAALLLIADPERAARLDLSDADNWSSINRRTDPPTEVPGVLAKSRNEVAPILGFRHISGIEPWDPWAQARFLAGFIDDQKKSFAETAALVGEAEGSVRQSYRNYRAARQLKKLGVDSKPLVRKFGVFTRAMQDAGIRKFIGAPAGQDVKARKNPLPTGTASKKRVREVVTWLFGTKTTDPLFTDSRKISELGEVLDSKEALEELRNTGDLEAAFALTGGIKTRLLGKLARASAALDQASIDIGGYGDDPEVQAALDVCAEGLRALQAGDDG